MTRGAEIIYEKVFCHFVNVTLTRFQLLAPEFRRREVSIDALLANAVSRAQPLAFQTLTTAGGVLARGVAGVLTVWASLVSLTDFAAELHGYAGAALRANARGSTPGLRCQH